MILACAQTLLTSPKKTMSSSWSMGKLTSMTISPSTLVTDSKTPPSGSKKSTPLKEFDQLPGKDINVSSEDTEELPKPEDKLSKDRTGDGFERLGGMSDHEEWPERLGNKSASKEEEDQEEWLKRLGDTSAKDRAGDGEKDRGNGSERLNGRSAKDDDDEEEDHEERPKSLGLASEVKIVVSESKTSSTPAALSAFSAEGTSDLTGSSFSPKVQSDIESLFESSIASEISVMAKLSGPIGMTLELNPAPTGVIVTGTEKDRLNSIVPDKLKLTEPAISSVSLKRKELTVNNTEAQNLVDSRKCSTSKTHIFYIIIFIQIFDFRSYLKCLKLNLNLFNKRKRKLKRT